jgi:hypothetical protein
MSTNHTLPVGTVVNYRGSARHGRYVVMGQANHGLVWIESIVSGGVYASGSDGRRTPVDLCCRPASISPLWRDGGFVTIDPQDRF